ncbi:MAG: hypothetical protein CMF31_03970 [Kordiimonas sp.]|nr:hypothetical protein [Kordiimonas sp.]|tara:strand:- start:2657 stop:3232 length:576 start_codon:yes stop_codon:yes gene_type:complete
MLRQLVMMAMAAILCTSAFFVGGHDARASEVQAEEKSLAQQLGVSPAALKLAEQAVPVQWLKSFLPGIAAQGREQLVAQLPTVTEEVKQAFEQGYLDEMNVALEKLILQIGVYYQDKWSVAEINDILGMLETPTGQLYLKGLGALEGPVGHALEAWIRVVPEQAATKTADMLASKGLLPTAKPEEDGMVAE